MHEHGTWPLRREGSYGPAGRAVIRVQTDVLVAQVVEAVEGRQGRRSAWIDSVRGVGVTRPASGSVASPASGTNGIVAECNRCAKSERGRCRACNMHDTHNVVGAEHAVDDL